MADLTIYQDEDGYWLINERREDVAGPFATYQDADDVLENPPPAEPDEDIYHTSDRPSTVREQYEAAWAVKQSLR